MSNIWEFLLQTTEVTLTAVVLLMLKLLFQDKLSPRWQYGVWAILAAKLLLPAGLFGKYMSLNLAAGIDVLKTMTESQLESSFSTIYQLILPTSCVPALPATPTSITDWLFVFYIAGIIVSIGYYLWGYLRLKLILRKGWTPGAELNDKITGICSKHQLPTCRTLIMEGIESAFVCGLIRPILVIPAHQEETIDEKIIIHELMHKKYFDAWQNTFWTMMRCVHWCNPIMQLVFNRIGNDMESLCDQRVLERIEGEDRRDYGRILLEMTNSKYARAMGTTSLSNGGRNIKRRIEAIVRFKRYPKGMALVSVCICILLVTPVFGGTASHDLDADSVLDGNGQLKQARARVMGCETQAGAIDTYIKGLVYDKELYLAASLPMDKQGQINQILSEVDLEPIYHQYYVLNLKEIEKDIYKGYVLLCEEMYVDDEGDGCMPVDMLPIRVCKDVRGWNAEMTGGIERVELSENIEFYYQTQLPVLASYKQTFEKGTVTLEEQEIWIVKKETNENDMWAFMFEDNSMTHYADPNAEFDRSRLRFRVIYDSNLNAEEREKITRVDLSTRALKNPTDEPNWAEDANHMIYSHNGSADGDGMSIISRSPEGDWDGTLDMDYGVFDTYSELNHPGAYAVRVYLNRLPSENIIIEREEGGR